MTTHDQTTVKSGLSASSLLPADSRSKKPNLLTLAIGAALIAVGVAGVFLSESPAVVGVWCIAVMLVLMFLGVPVAIALSVPSLLGIYAVSGVKAVANVLSVAPYSTVSEWTFSVLPMFIFMGMLFNQAGMSHRISVAADRWFAWLPGGLGIGANAAGAGLSAVSGSTIGMTYTLARSSIPEMLRAGYDRRFAVGSVMVAGMSGNLIPPSILMVVYAGIASVPIGAALASGVVPGILLVVSYSVFIAVLGLLVPRLVGRGKNSTAIRPRYTWRQRLESLVGLWGLVLVIVVLFGGMFSGLFTPTEAGAGAALITLVLAIYHTRKSNPVRQVTESAFATVSASAAIFFIIIGAEMLTRMLALTGLARMMTDFILHLGLDRVGFLLVLIVLYIIMGMFFDTFSMMLLTIPILLPTLVQFDVSLLWFGAFVVLLGELSMLTPPLGVLTYIVYSITRSPTVNLGHKITLGDLFVALLWFLPVAILFLVLMIFFPQIAEWLPGVVATQ